MIPPAKGFFESRRFGLSLRERANCQTAKVVQTLPLRTKSLPGAGRLGPVEAMAGQDVEVLQEDSLVKLFSLKTRANAGKIMSAAAPASCSN